MVRFWRIYVECIKKNEEKEKWETNFTGLGKTKRKLPDRQKDQPTVSEGWERKRESVLERETERWRIRFLQQWREVIIFSLSPHFFPHQYQRMESFFSLTRTTITTTNLLPTPSTFIIIAIQIVGTITPAHFSWRNLVKKTRFLVGFLEIGEILVI